MAVHVYALDRQNNFIKTITHKKSTNEQIICKHTPFFFNKNKILDNEETILPTNNKES